MTSQSQGQYLQALWQSYAPNPQIYLQEQQPSTIQNQQVPITNSQGARAQNMLTNPTLDQTLFIPKQKTSQLPLQYEQRNVQSTNIPIEQTRSTAMEHIQFRTPYSLRYEVHKTR